MRVLVTLATTTTSSSERGCAVVARTDEYVRGWSACCSCRSVRPGGIA